MKAINPATGTLVKEYAEPDDAQVEAWLEQGHRVQQTWKRTDFAHRRALMHRAADILRERADEYARLMAEEMGKPIAQGRAEVEKSAWVCDYYADEAEGFLTPEPIETDAQKSYVSFQPLGVVLAVMPWNFPFWQVFRFAAPAMMAGNGGLLKHAGNVPGSALAIEQVFLDAGFPEGLFRTLLISASKVAPIIKDKRVAAVTLTGSTPAGKAVASTAASVIKKSVLELGGSDPALVLEDADLDLAVSSCVASRMINGGQSCIAAKRFIVVESLLEEFEKRFVAEMAARKMGDPLDEETQVGPLARADLRDEIHDQVQRSVAAGASLLLGGEVPEGPGAYYPPTVLSNVRSDTPAYSEEIFGPVAAIIPVKDEAEAVHVANDTIFGLGAAVFTADAARGERIANEEIEAGSCFVNTFVRSDPRLPFGGIKESGYGRELADYGIREFVNIKTVFIA